MNSFETIGLAPDILQAIKDLGFETPTPIQQKTIPHLLGSNQDLIALAQTGTGKTAAFGLPAVQLISAEDREPQVLVLCPTRELCLQISKDLESFSKYKKGVEILAVYGGSSIETQIRALKRGVQIVVATPGRAKDLIHRGKLDLSKVSRVILDEADEMLSMGFKEELDFILDETPESKQTLLFSATMSKPVLAIASKYMDQPLELSAATRNEGAENVEHIYYMVQAKDRYEVLKRVADMNPDVYGIVFCRTRMETKEIANKLIDDGYNADALHGDLSQAQRDEVMGRFRNRNLQLLIATDVAARGLDVNDLTHVINYNLPDDIESYIHRSGRTGRAGKSGISIAIIHSRETGRIREIEKKAKISFTREMVPTGRDICKVQLYALIDRIEKIEVDESQIGPFLPEIYEKLGWLSREQLIKHFVSAEFNQFLNYYKNARDINIAKGNERSEGGKQGKRSPEERRQYTFTRLFINVGSRQNLNPSRLIGLINEGLNSGNAEIGKIEIMRNFSFFEIEEAVDSKLIKALEGQPFEGISLHLEVSKEKPSFVHTPKMKKKHKDFAKAKHNRKPDGSWKKKKHRGK